MKTSNTGYPKLSAGSERPRRKKTPNAERRTFNAEQLTARLNDGSAVYSSQKVKFDLEDRLLEFAVSVIALVESLPASRAGNHIAGQLLRSGTSPYGHHGEVESAESRKDFVHKLKSCLKELREARRWLRLIARMKKLTQNDHLSACLSESDELIRIFVASVRTTESRK